MQSLQAEKINSFADENFPNIKDVQVFVEKDNIFGSLTADIINYLTEYMVHIQTNNLEMPTEIYLGYIIYSQMEIPGGKMANILNLLVQNQNPNVRIQSQWDIISSEKVNIPCAVSTVNTSGFETKKVDKIKIKIIIRPNNKDMAIKKITQIALENMFKANKKSQSYLSKYKMIIGDK